MDLSLNSRHDSHTDHTIPLTLSDAKTDVSKGKPVTFVVPEGSSNTVNLKCAIMSPGLSIKIYSREETIVISHLTPLR